MHKNILLSLAIIFLCFPLLSMEEKKEKLDPVRTKTIAFLKEISDALTDKEKFSALRGSKIPNIVWDLALANYSKDIQFLSSSEYPAHIASIQKALQSEEVISEISEFSDFNKIKTSTIGEIIRKHTAPISSECKMTNSPKRIASEQPEKTFLETHRKKSSGVQHQTTKQLTQRKKPEDIFGARELLMQIYKMRTFESDANDFHCVYGNCKETYTQRNNLTNHLHEKHQKDLDEINKLDLFNITITPKTLMQVMDFSNNFKEQNRMLKKSL